MYYNYKEVVYAGLPTFLKKSDEMYLFNELDRERQFKHVGFLLVKSDEKLYKAVYVYNS